MRIKPTTCRVLAIDPGFERVGIAIIEKFAGKEKLLHSECFKTSAHNEFPERLKSLGIKVGNVIKEWKPDAFTTEKLFLSVNQKTAMRVSEARGVIIYEASKAGLPVREFTPLEIKMAITGYGKATKNQVSIMVRKLISFPDKKALDDELDAVAAGLTFFAYQNYPHKSR
ncbi:MAG: crossover junction endodeoxyribonuclease RuvC [Patescibacteria group bacterium]